MHPIDLDGILEGERNNPFRVVHGEKIKPQIPKLIDCGEGLFVDSEEIEEEHVIDYTEYPIYDTV